MRLFTTLDLFAEVTAATKKWERTLEALDAAPTLAEGVAYSIGDSLTYRRGRAQAFATDHFIGRRRYHQVVAATGGDVVVDIAAKTDLTEAGPYDDLTDRQPFTGVGQTVTVPRDGILIVDIDEAARVLPTPDSEAVVLRVTVEGATFHNK